MKWIHWSRVAVLAIVGLVATTVTAGASYSRSGFYVGGGGTYAAHLFEGDLDDLLPEISINLNGSPGFHFQFGYRLLPVLALEGEYEQVSGFDAEIEGVPLFDLSARSLTANLRLFIPIYRIQPFFVVGIGATSYDVEDSLGLNARFEDSATAVRLKGGIDGYITKHFAITGSFGGVLTTHDLRNPTTAESFSGLHYLAAQFGVTIRF